MSQQKVAVVTGANKGIGLAIVKHLCPKFDGVVYLAARDEERGKAAVAELEKLGLHPKFQQLDIDSPESIERFRDFIKETHGGLDILINNASMAYKHAATESKYEQAENTIRVNFFGTMILCDSLFPLLRKHARVVNVSSSLGHLSQINGSEPGRTELRNKLSSPNATQQDIIDLANNFVSLTKEEKHTEAGWSNSTYAVSKVAISALTRVQQRKFDETPEMDWVVNSVHPGYVITDMTSQKGDLTVDEGCQAPLWCALLPPNVEEPRGGYVWCDSTIRDWVN